MTLWEYLKNKMHPFADRVAFVRSQVTYADLLRLEHAPSGQRKLRLCESDTREKHALDILRCIAEGDIAVPITSEYGEQQCEEIRWLIQESSEDISDLAFVIFTSGTTGKPKGVMLTHENICTALEYISTYFRLECARRICIARPLAHIAVLVGELLYALCNGMAIHFYEEAFMPRRLKSYCIANGIEVLCATPTLYRLLARANPDGKLLIKIGAISGEPLNAQEAREITSAFPDTAFYNVYGLTEHSPRVSALLPSEFRNRPCSVGKPIGDVRLLIRDGELLVSSPCVMKGYFADKCATWNKLRGGWLHTGDRAHFDGDGFLYIDGRIDGMLIRGGINVYPEEIEAAASSVVGVDECIVSGEVNDYGTAVLLLYTGDISSNELRKALMRKLNPHVLPDRIERVQGIAHTPSGKKVR